MPSRSDLRARQGLLPPGRRTFQGPVYLRSSNHNLPDLVAALHGRIDIEAVARLDSQHGGIRTSFEGIPDAPVSKAVFDFPGGKKGLIVNSRELCAKRSFANVKLVAHNGRKRSLRPLVQAGCPKQQSKRR